MSRNEQYDRKQGMQPNPGGDDPHIRPRRPRPDTEARLLTGSPRAAASSQQSTAAKSSTLSVNAPEFVPKGFQPHADPPQVHEFSDPAVLLSAVAPEFVPSGGFVPRSGLLPPDVCLSSQPQGVAAAAGDFVDSFSQLHMDDAGNQSAYLSNEFQNSLMFLMTQPANIHEYLGPLCGKLQMMMNPQLLQDLVNILYEQSIYEPNFRYTGARVCQYLCQHLKDHPLYGQFKQVFLQKCQQDFLNREKLITSGESGVSTLCGLALFMGELFLNVTVEQEGHVERLEFLPHALTELMLTLLKHPSDISVKTTCQLLKMAGGPTEDKMKQNPQSAELFSNIFSALAALRDSQKLAPNMKALVESVLKLKQDSWGRAPLHQTQVASAEQTRQVDYAQGLEANEPVFYNVHGKQITREEAGYTEEPDIEDGHYVLTDEEEQEYLAWQAETNPYCAQLARGQANQLPDHSNPMGYDMSGGYQPWSTDDGYGDYQPNYNYEDYNGDDGYTPYLPDGLTMDEEAEQAYEDFLKSQHGGSARK